MGRASLRFSSAIIMEIFTVVASSRQKKNETSLLFRSAFYGVFSSFYNKDIHLLTASRASCWQAFYTLLFFVFSSTILFCEVDVFSFHSFSSFVIIIVVIIVIIIRALFIYRFQPYRVSVM